MPSASDSDSDYGSRSKKKKRAKSGDELRVSSRGGKVPNYVDDVDGFEKFEQEEEDAGYYVAPVAQYEEGDEIEAVLTHSRDEGHEDDPADVWNENVVCNLPLALILTAQCLIEIPYQVEKLFPSTQH